MEVDIALGGASVSRASSESSLTEPSSDEDVLSGSQSPSPPAEPRVSSAVAATGTAKFTTVEKTALTKCSRCAYNGRECSIGVGATAVRISCDECHSRKVKCSGARWPDAPVPEPVQEAPSLGSAIGNLSEEVASLRGSVETLTEMMRVAAERDAELRGLLQRKFGSG
ncbi:hypothetical protein EXIGLDRAFT_769602 [Exidia glandulosa HHB12029]|uniref:Zn(2)-C6 fungal-type domain-containing protein n=1 Tax=Exidia glandulosa HHB12029 TaxID=1314781 RepID=A0A165HC09_EXIGL|nr:hypothetical protein EXIGLDRAFT_769602 [Exidia glandulosa HHB12029]